DAEDGRGDDLSLRGGERALEDHPGPIHVPMDRVDVTARHAGEDAVAHPVQDRVQGAEEVDVRPVGARAVVQCGAQPGGGDVAAGGELDGLFHAPVREVGLRQVVEAAGEVIVRGELDQARTLVDHEVDAAAGDGTAGLGEQLSQSRQQEVGV